MFNSFLALLFLYCLPAYSQQLGVPALSEVVDGAGLFKNPEQIRKSIRRIYLAGGPQIAVLTVNALTNTSLEQYSIKVVDEWQLGDKEKDDGVLLLIVKDSRQIRIEVGQGLEGSLTDAKASDVIAYSIQPEFKQGRFDSGALSGIAEILAITNPDLDTGIKRRQRGLSDRQQLIRLLIFLAFILLIVFNNNTRSNLPVGSRSNHRWGNNSGYWRGGGGGFGGGSGGGFGGGGGGFSGGGSSGGW